jgi:hypothetical protein
MGGPGLNPNTGYLEVSLLFPQAHVLMSRVLKHVVTAFFHTLSNDSFTITNPFDTTNRPTCRWQSIFTSVKKQENENIYVNAC